MQVEQDEIGGLLSQPPRKAFTYSPSGSWSTCSTSTSSALRFYGAAASITVDLLPQVGCEEPACAGTPAADLLPKSSQTEVQGIDAAASEFMAGALHQLKQELNSTKGLLSSFDIVKWSGHTSRTQPCGDVVAHVAREYNAELCTNAWCKMYEILASFREMLPEWAATSSGSSSRFSASTEPLPAATPGERPTPADTSRSLRPLLPSPSQELPTEPPLFTSVHLCEAPGAFVCALNHYIKTEGLECRHKWLASTLNPWYEGNKLDSMVNDDRFILQTNERWSFGGDQSGDILVLENRRCIASDARSRLGRAMLVTADGSFDCQDEPAEQERLVYPLLAAELYCALLVISKGGSLVLKMFTAFETASTVLIFFLTVAFDTVTIFKPITSKPGNSELYVVCSGYRHSAHWMSKNGGVLEAAAAAFEGAIRHGLPILDPSCVPAEFLVQHEACCQAFKTWQDETILSNIRLYKMPWSVWRHRARERRQECCLLYDELCMLKPISNDDKITGMSLCDTGSGSTKPYSSAAGGRRRLSGSYEERVLWSGLSWEQYVSSVGFYELPAATSGRWVATTLSREFPYSVITGKRLQAINSSRFCDHELVAELSRFVRHVCERESEAVFTSQTTGAGLNDGVVQLALSDVGAFLSSNAPVTLKDAGDLENLIMNIRANTTSVTNRLVRIDTNYDWLELRHRTCLLEALLMTFKMLKYLPEPAEASDVTESSSGPEGVDAFQHTVVMLPFSTLLTRFSVSCLYVLWSCFAEVSFFVADSAEFDQRPTGPLLHLCCRGPVSPALASRVLDQLQDTQAACSIGIGGGSSTLARPSVDVLEFVPIRTLLADEKFVSFVLATNRLAVKLLVNWLLACEQLALAKMATADDKAAYDTVLVMP